MLRWLIALFITVPVFELVLLIEIGRLTGLLPTLMLVVLTGITGAWLTRMQGLKVLRAIREDLHDGHVPTDNLMDGALIAVAGLFLLTPGLLTDTLGFILLVPGCRTSIRRALIRTLSSRFGHPGSTIDLH